MMGVNYTGVILRPDRLGCGFKKRVRAEQESHGSQLADLANLRGWVRK
jgi:hypothetical protein